MGVGFGTTFGVGTTDRITTSLVGQSALRTWAFRFLYNGSGGGGFGRVLDAGQTIEQVFVNGSNLAYARWWNGAQAVWALPGTLVQGTTYSMVVTSDQTSASGVVNCWLNGIVTYIGAGSGSPRVGTPDSTASPYNIGNRNDNARNFDGIIYGVACWNSIVPDNFCTAISKGVSPLIYRSSLVYYNRMISTGVNNIVGTPGSETVTGTVIRPHLMPQAFDFGVRPRRGKASVLYPTVNRIIFDGSSTIAGFGLADPSTQGLTAQTIKKLGTSWHEINQGVAGTALSTIAANALSTTGVKRQPRLQRDWAMVSAGINDLAGGATATTVYGSLTAYCNTLKALGFIVIVTTLQAQNRGAPAETERISFNSTLRANFTFADILVDFAADSRFDTPAKYTNTTFYQSDQIHWTAVGAAGAADLVVAAIVASGSGTQTLIGTACDFSQPQNAYLMGI